MAEIAVGFLVYKLETLLQEEDDLSKQIYIGEVRRIKHDFETITSFLRYEDARGSSDEGFKEWITQVTDIAHQIEDTHDESMDGDRFGAFLKKTAQFMKHLKARYRIATGNLEDRGWISNNIDNQQCDSPLVAVPMAESNVVRPEPERNGNLPNTEVIKLPHPQSRLIQNNDMISMHHGPAGEQRRKLDTEIKEVRAPSNEDENLKRKLESMERYIMIQLKLLNDTVQEQLRAFERKLNRMEGTCLRIEEVIVGLTEGKKRVRESPEVIEVLTGDKGKSKPSEYVHASFKDAKQKRVKVEVLNASDQDERKHLECILKYAFDDKGEENSAQVLVNFERFSMTRKELIDLLLPEKWVSNIAITCYGELLMWRQRVMHGHVLCHNFPTYIMNDINRSTEELGKYYLPEKLGYRLSDCHYVFVPVCSAYHWNVLCFDLQSSAIVFINSIASRAGLDNQEKVLLLIRLFEGMLNATGQAAMKPTQWPWRFEHDIPQQANMYDCGIYAILYMEHWRGKMMITITEDDLPRLRWQIAVDLLMSDYNKNKAKILLESKAYNPILSSAS